MILASLMTSTVSDVADAAARQLVSVRHCGSSTFINLPLIYPSGSFVTVKLDRVYAGFRVSDNGFAYRELESVGAQRSFPRVAASAAEAELLECNRRAIFVEVSDASQVVRAITDVAMASWQVADRVISRIADQEEADIAEHLQERLSRIFGEDSVKPQHKLVGSSTTEWEISAVVQLPNKQVGFHAVSNHQNSVFRTSTAFRDLASLDRPPVLVAVVHSKSDLGPKLLGLLAQAGRVIEDEQPDKAYSRAAA